MQTMKLVVDNSNMPGRYGGGVGFVFWYRSFDYHPIFCLFCLLNAIPNLF